MKMSLRGNWIFLIVSLGIAFWASRPKDSGSTDSQLWHQFDSDDLVSIRYQDPKKLVTINSDGWVTEAAIKDNIPLPESKFKGNASLSRVIDPLSKMMALKVIGSAKDLKLEDYQLDHKTSTLSIKTGKASFDYVIGKRSFQTSQVYLLDESRSQVILAERSPINFLRDARARLFEKRIVKLDLKVDVDGVEVKANGKSFPLTVKSSAKKKLIWQKNSDQDAASEGSWIEKLVRQKVIAYGYPQLIDKVNGQVPKAEVIFSKQGKQVELLTLFAITGAENKQSYWLKSAFLGTLVQIDQNQGQTLFQDLDNLLL